MNISVFTIFPEIIDSFASVSILGRAVSDGVVSVETHDIRNFGFGKHRSVDDTPFGGGAGMVMSPEPIVSAYEKAGKPRPLLLMTPSGTPFTQQKAIEFSKEPEIAILCGRYEGIDQRVIDSIVDEEISIGDYVLGGGEVAASVVIEAVTRLLPGVMGNEFSAGDESFSEALLEYPQYTRPAEFNGATVPEVLVSGNHGEIANWRLAQSIAKTLRVRPDLIEARGGLTDAEKALVERYAALDYNERALKAPESQISRSNHHEDD